MALNDQVVKAGYWYCSSDFPVPNIDSSLFTHLFAAFADVNRTTYEVTFPPIYKVQFETFTETVRRRNSLVKTLLSIGGDTHHLIIARMTSQPASRQAFINSSISVARTYNYDGLSLNWQYPNTSAEMKNLGEFLIEWRAAVEEESRRTGKTRLLVTAAVSYSSDRGPSLKYPFQAISISLDWINIMAYDLYTPGSSRKLTRPPAPLFNPTSCQLSVDAGVRAWIHAGVPPNKLVLGLPFHGRSWLLDNANNHEISSPAKGVAQDIDPIPYKKIVNMPLDGDVYDPTYVTDYCYAGTKWIGYDGKQSIFTKGRYGKTKGLLGYFAWHVADDTPEWTLSKEASKVWDQFAPAIGGNTTCGNGIGGAGTGGALTFGNVTVTGSAGNNSNVIVTVIVGTINVGNVAGGNGIGGTGTGGTGTSNA